MDEKNKKWVISVDELIEIFRGALISIIPWIERAQIKWKEGESYDDWDEIAQVLYKNIISNSFKYSSSKQFNLVRYDIRYNNYQNLSFIKVTHGNITNNFYAFVGFKNTQNIFDSIEVAIIEPTTLNVVGYQTIPYNSSSFSFNENINKDMNEMKSITVEL